MPKIAKMTKIMVSLRSVVHYESNGSDVLIKYYPYSEKIPSSQPLFNRQNTLTLGSLVILKF